MPKEKESMKLNWNFQRDGEIWIFSGSDYIMQDTAVWLKTPEKIS